MDTALRLAAGAGLVLANAFFVAAEFALTRLRQFTEDDLGDRPALRRAWEMTERLEIHLTGCQLGITASSILLGVVAEPAVTRLLEATLGFTTMGPGTRHLVSVVAAVVAINLVHKVWGEQAPTYLGVERPLGVLARLSTPLRWWTRVMSPVIRLGDGLAKATLRLFGVEIERSWTEDGRDRGGEGPITSFVELRRRLKDVLERGGLGRERRREVLRALEIEDVPVRSIMVPRSEVVALSTRRTLEENFRVVSRHPYIRFPLVGSGLDEVLGTVYAPILLRELDGLLSSRVSLEDVAVPPLVVEPELSVSDAIDRFQEAEQEMAVVVDDGRTVGVVTSTDAFESIAGELQDPLD